MKKSSFFGFLALASIATYFYYAKNEDSNPSLEGFNIKLEPDKLIDSALAYKQVNPQYREPIKNVANKIISKMLVR